MRTSTALTWIIAAMAGLTLGCAQLPTVSSPAPADAQFAEAETPAIWAQRGSACGDAARRANRVARGTCELSSFTAAGEACECELERSEGKWGCTAKAVFTCDDSMLSQN